MAEKELIKEIAKINLSERICLWRISGFQLHKIKTNYLFMNGRNGNYGDFSINTLKREVFANVVEVPVGMQKKYR